jgi:putative two-component system response regulator
MQQATILVVDDEAAVREILADHLTIYGYTVRTAASAETALADLPQYTPDLILLDVHLPGMDGIALCAHLKATRVAVLLRVKALLDHLEHAEHVLTTLGLTIEARDPYTAGHCARLARYAVALGQALGVEAPLLKALWLGGFLHDLGKIAIPDRVLLKAGPLEPPERVLIQTHPVVGADLVQEMRTLDEVRPIIRHHHERFDGSGYPDRLRGEAIPLGARIMAVVDVYDALSTARPYKAAFSHERAVAILCQETEAQYWDPQIITTFLEVLRTLDSSPDH